VTDFGSYADAWQAGNSEDEVNWFDRDESDDRICTEAFAAVELRNYLCRIGGLDPEDKSLMPIVNSRPGLPSADCIIVVGRCALEEPYNRLNREISHKSSEAFLVRSGKINSRNILIIRGNSRAGALYGVYDLLEQLGCRWFGPGPMGEIIPRRARISLKHLDHQEAPATDLRGFWISDGEVESRRMTWEGSYTDRGNPEFFDWMGKNRLNFFWNKEKLWRGMKKRGINLSCGGHVPYLELLHPDTPYSYDHPLFKGDESLPADPYPLCKEYAGDLNGDNRLVYSEAHPEWYGLTSQGKRFFPTTPFGTNYCSSSQSGFNEFMKNMIGYFQQDGVWHNAEILDFWPLDGGEWCRCPACRNLGNETDQLLHMLYKVRKRLHQAYLDRELNRDIKVYSLIYIQTVVLPSRELPPDFDYQNTAMVYFPILRCYAHNFDDPSCTETNQRYLDILNSWLSPECKYRGRLFLGEYYNISGFRDLPLVFKTTMAHDIPFFIRSGISGFHYMHTPTTDLGVRRLTNYQMARTLWNPDLDPAALWDDYFRNLYGPSAEDMRTFYDLLEKVVSNVRAWRYHLLPQMKMAARGKADSIFPMSRMSEHLHYEPYHPEKNDGLDWQEMIPLLKQCRRCIDTVLASDLPSEVRQRVQEDEYGFRYLEAMLDFYDSLISLFILPADDTEARQEAFAQATRNAERLKNYRIKNPALGVKNAYEAADLGDVYDYVRKQFED